MIYKGLKFRKCRTVGYREPKEGDTDRYGNPLTNVGVAFVKISDCRLYDKDGRTFYDPSDAKAIPLSYGASYYGYSKLKRKRLFDGLWEYYRSVYLVKDSKVYMSCIKYTSQEAINRQLEVEKRHANS